jgi:hypothetical protein
MFRAKLRHAAGAQRSRNNPDVGLLGDTVRNDLAGLAFKLASPYPHHPKSTIDLCFLYI